MARSRPTEHRLPAETRSVRAARQAVSDAVGDAIPEGELEGVLLATSEVVTNAVEHGSPPIDLRVDSGEHVLRIEVHDASPVPPRSPAEAPAPEEVRGRGMTIVDQLTHRWGVDERVDGKSVWFELQLDEERGPNDATPPT